MRNTRFFAALMLGMTIIPGAFAESGSHKAHRKAEERAAEDAALLETSHLPHKVRDLSDADSALDARIAAIQSLEEGDKIAIESYIFTPDKVGSLILRLLVQKKKELGDKLQVRILVDGFPFQKDSNSIDDVLARSLGDIGIEFKHYNKGTILNVTRAIRRNHRKLFIVKKKDKDALVITGGRNIADEYFNQGKKFNFLDRDILIEGPLGDQILKSFDAQFNDRLAKPISKFDGNVPELQSYLRGSSPRGRENAEAHYKMALAEYNRRKARADSILNPSEEDQRKDEIFRNIIHKTAAPREFRNPPVIADDVSFFSDPPGLKFSEHTSARVLAREIRNTKRTLLIDNFQFSPKGKLKEELHNAAKRDVVITTSVNGKGASEYGILYYFTHRGEKAAKNVSDENFRFYNFSGKLLTYSDLDEPPPSDKTAAKKANEKEFRFYDTDGRFLNYGDLDESLPPVDVRAIIHSKSFVIDDSTSIVSTFNVAARSSFLNSECGIIVRGQPALAKTISANTWSRIGNSKAVDQVTLSQSAPGFFYRNITGPLSTLIEDNF
jgi:phosphatidylserine/phosphatidylglycerophosphate/cardiolipin synthase-like enzyme